MAPDFKRLAAEVSAKHGIRVDPDDPMMAVVTLNCLMLESAAEEVEKRVQRALGEFQSAIDRLQIRAGQAIADETRERAGKVRVHRSEDVEVRPTHPERQAHRCHWLGRHPGSLLLAFMAFLGGLGVGLWSR